MLIRFVALISCLLLTFPSFLMAHAGHQHGPSHLGSLEEWIQWIGHFHLVLIHFPISLVILTGVADLFYYRTSNVLFNHAAHFMLFTAALLSIPTSLLGLALGYQAEYEGILSHFYWWHQFIGFLIPPLAFITLYLRNASYWIAYGWTLSFLIVSILVTSFLGGGMVYGLERLSPPPFK